MRVRHARQTGALDNPARPAHMGGDEWDADHIVEGTWTDAEIPASIARDAEVDSKVAIAVAALVASAPAALNTLDELAAALADDANYAATTTAALAGKQPLDADLTAIAALSTTPYGRALLALADQAALLAAAGASASGHDHAGTYQPVDSDLTAIAALTTTAFGRTFLDLADAAAARTKLSLGSLATANSITHAATTGQTANDHHNQVHGPTDHSNVTRKLFLPAALAKLDGGTAANIGASPDLTGVIACADAATQGAFWTFMVPSDWDSGTFTAQPVWAPGSTDGVAHTVRWSAQYKAIASGSDVTAAGTADGWTGNSATRTAGVVVYDGLSTTPAPATAGDLFRVLVRRVGGDAGDTYVGIVNLLGIVLAYTANQ